MLLLLGALFDMSEHLTLSTLSNKFNFIWVAVTFTASATLYLLALAMRAFFNMLFKDH